MARPFYNIKNIVINDNISIYFRTQDTSYGFRHLAELLEVDNNDIEKYETTTAKCTYYNRTWESFDYQTVGHKVIRKHLVKYKEYAEETIMKFDEIMTGKVEDFYKTVGMIAKIGNVIADTQKDKNDWKLRMIKAGVPEMSLPEDWNTLPEDEKESRLNNIIEFMNSEREK
jgi:hypothetical protein